MVAVERHMLILLGPAQPRAEELQVRANFQGMLKSVAEDLADLLPEGWSVQIYPEIPKEGRHG